MVERHFYKSSNIQPICIEPTRAEFFQYQEPNRRRHIQENLRMKVCWWKSRERSREDYRFNRENCAASPAVAQGADGGLDSPWYWWLIICIRSVTFFFDLHRSVFCLQRKCVCWGGFSGPSWGRLNLHLNWYNKNDITFEPISLSTFLAGVSSNMLCLVIVTKKVATTSVMMMVTGGGGGDDERRKRATCRGGNLPICFVLW